MLNVSTTSSSKEQLEQLCHKTIYNSQDFTDSVYISIEQREQVLDFHRKLQEQLAEIIQMISNNQDVGLSLAIQSIQQVARDFRKQVRKNDLIVWMKACGELSLVGRNGHVSCIGILSHT